MDVKALSKLIAEHKLDRALAQSAMMGAVLATERLPAGLAAALTQIGAGAAGLSAAVAEIGRSGAMLSCAQLRRTRAEDVAPRIYVPDYRAIAPTIAAPVNPFTSADPWIKPSIS